MGTHLIFAATISAIAIRLWLTRDRPLTPGRVVTTSLFYLLCVQWGIGSATLALGHILFSDLVAGFIGWEPGSPFQVELGFASLGLALLGVLCIWIRGWFWLAPVLGQSVFLLGAAYVHVQDIISHGNLAPGNAGPILFYDMVLPLLGCTLFYLHYRLGGIERES